MGQMIWRGLVGFSIFLYLFSAAAQQESKKAKLEKELAFLNGLIKRATSIIQKWAKEGDFEGLKRGIEIYAQRYDLKLEFSIEGARIVKQIFSRHGFKFDTKGELIERWSNPVEIELARTLRVVINSRLTSKVDLSFRHEPLSEVIQRLTDGLDFICPIDKEMTEKMINVRLRNVNVVDALYLILKTCGYELYINDNLYTGRANLYREIFTPGYLAFKIPEELLERYYKLLSEKTENFLSDAAYCQAIIDNPDKLNDFYIERIKEKTKHLRKLVITIKKRGQAE
jgi:hypothetical protein